MIYLFHGSDVGKTRAKAFAWVKAARAKAPDAAYIRLEGAEITASALTSAIGTQGLFFSKTLLLIDNPFAEDESKEAILDLLKELAASENPVGLLAPKLTAAELKKVEPHAAKIFKEDAKPKAERGFNGTLVNALAARDGKALWLELMKAERLGDAPEATHGLLHWKARDLIKKGNAKWKGSEARDLSLRLILLPSQAYAANLTLSLALERFALSL